ncbi:DNA ligase [Anaeramoeba flamelloides]|uniref:NAD(+) ADP-ribosyltransferase n=1 Tax=Anaeramoeba flamelloides TaxID=1746091 RepID=A0AAV7YC65_9EUKA|nr:DNA ligase [Anaeramoeba flamelloides]
MSFQKSTITNNQETEIEKKKKRVPVSSASTYKSKGQVFERDCEIFSCMLNQTNINSNNNKYYEIQIIEIGNGFILFTHWGRVGSNGYTNEKSYEKEDVCIEEFKKKFFQKTANRWNDRANFKCVQRKYNMLEIDY